MAAAPPQLRVRDLGGVYHPVRLVRKASEIGVKEAIALAVGLPVGTFSQNSEGGRLHTDRRLDRGAPPHPSTS